MCPDVEKKTHTQTDDGVLLVSVWASHPVLPEGNSEYYTCSTIIGERNNSQKELTSDESK